MLAGRCVPLVRSFISIPAGITRMPVWRFTLLTAAGSLVWNSIFVFSGFFLGESWHIVERYADILQYVVIAAAVIGVAWFLYVRVRALLESRGAPEPGLD